MESERWVSKYEVEQLKNNDLEAENTQKNRNL